MTEKPYSVITPFGIAWVVKFKTEDAAWIRIVRPAKHKDESEVAAKDRMKRKGWRVIDTSNSRLQSVTLL